MDSGDEFRLLRDKLELDHVAPPWEAERLSRIARSLPPEPIRGSKGLPRRRGRRRGGIGARRKREIYVRDQGVCQIKGPLCDARVSPGIYRKLTIEEATVDHIIPRSRGGSSNRLNLQCACVPCNNWKGSWTMQEVEPMLNLLRGMEA